MYALGEDEKQIIIYYSSSLNGNLDGCDCKSNPRSGLVKRAFLLRNIDKTRSILLDTGDIFDVYKDTILSDYILQSYIDLQYDAVAVGDQEFSNGADYVRKRTGDNLLISSNLRIKDDRSVFRQVSESHFLLNRGKLKITVLSITDPEVFRFYPEEITEAIKIEKPEKTIRTELNIPEVNKSDLILLLFHGSLDRVRELASMFPAINIIIVGHEQQILNGEMIGKTIILSPGGEGNLLGDLNVSVKNQELIFNNNFISFNYLTDPDDPVIRNRIEDYNTILKQRLNN